MQEFAPFFCVVCAILWQSVVLFRWGNFVMVTSALVACAIIYGYKAGHSRSDIKDNLAKMGEKIGLGTSANMIKKHVGEAGRLKAKNAMGKRKRCKMAQGKLNMKAKKKIVRTIKKKRGCKKVASTYLKKHLEETKGVSKRTIRRAINEFKIKYLRRRRKQVVSQPLKAKRIKFAKKMKKKTWDDIGNARFLGPEVAYRRCRRLSLVVNECVRGSGCASVVFGV